MKTRAKSKNDSDSVVWNIITTIRQEQFYILRRLNAKTLLLSWDIGDFLNHYVIKSKGANSHVLHAVSNKLVPAYGPLLNTENLALMWSFACSCSRDFAEKISWLLGWHYIPYFFDLNTEDEWLFYTSLVHEESLTPEQLGIKILEKRFEQDRLTQDYNSIIHKFAAYNAFNSLTGLQQYFTGAKTLPFRKLFSRKREDFTLSTMEDKGALAEKAESVSSMILKFQSDGHAYLNLMINCAFSSIGRTCFTYVKASDQQQQSNSFYAVHKRVEQQLGSYFNDDLLTSCIQFSQIFDPLQVVEVSELLSWDDIKLILPLNDPLAGLFYAHHSAKYGLTHLQLKELILSDFYKQQTDKKTGNKNTLSGSKNVLNQKRGNAESSIRVFASNFQVPSEYKVEFDLYESVEMLNFLKNYNS